MCPFRESALNAIKWCDALCNFISRFCVTLFRSDALHVLTSFRIFFQLIPFFITSAFFVPYFYQFRCYWWWYFQNVEQVHRARAYADCVQVWNMQISGVQSWWRQIHGRHAILNKRTIYACHEKLIQTGTSFNKKKQTKPSTTKDTKNIDTVRCILQTSPSKSLNEVKRECGLQVCRSTVYRIITNELNFRPWKPHYDQELQTNDYARRQLFADQMEAWLQQTPSLLNILWSDEAVFCVGEFVTTATTGL